MEVIMKNLSRYLSLIVIVLGTFTANSAYIHVPSDYPTVQAGVDGAVDGDTIVLADGTYTGVGNYNIDFGGRAITLLSNFGPSGCIIDAASAGQVFVFISGENQAAVVTGLTITGGIGLLGGGISIENASPTITGNVITTNQTSSRGGGIYLSNSDAVITDNLFINNTSASRGGALYMIDSDPVVTDNVMINNMTDSRAGAIYFYTSSPTLTNNLFAGNYSGSRGGAFYLYESHPVFINNTIVNNTGVDFGGGCYGYLSSPTFTNCIVWGNQAIEGLQMMFSSGTAAVTYCDVQGGWTGTGNLDADPMFVTGTFGEFYLSQLMSGEPATSACTDAGDSLASTVCFSTADGSACLDEYTTRTDNETDTGQVDLGYHYPPELSGPATPIPTNTPGATHTPAPTNTPGGPPTETPTNTPAPTDTPIPTPPVFFGDVVINEIMYDTSGNPEEEWVELYNRTGSEIDVSGWCICDDFTFPMLTDEGYIKIPDGVILSAGGYIVLAKRPSALTDCEIICIETGDFDISNTGEALSLWSSNNGAGILVDGSLIGPLFPDLLPNNADTTIEKCPEDAPWPDASGWQANTTGNTGCMPNNCPTPTPGSPVPTDTPLPTQTPTSIPTATPEPTDSPTPSATAEPTGTPTPIPTATPSAGDTPTPTPGDCINHGDVNFSGSITAGDAQLTFSIALGAYPATPEEMCAADCNGSGDVTAGDAQSVFAAALGAGSCVDPL